MFESRLPTAFLFLCRCNTFLKFLYKETGIKCIAGLNISWPYEDEIIIRVGFSLDINDLILNFELIGKAVEGLE